MKKSLLFTLGCFSLSCLGLPLKKGEQFRVQNKGEFIVKANANKIEHKIKKSLGQDLYLIEAKNKSDLEKTYLKVYPNYTYYGDFLDLSYRPNDRYIKKQHHHKQIETFKAWEISHGSEDVVIAVTDNEFQIDHKDLINGWWKNSHEIPGNNIDDDQNGYIDDVYGWDFFHNDNNVDSDDDPTHGTHVAGTIIGALNNGYGGAGVAPGVKVMPLRWYGGDGVWTTDIVIETYNYAINNGAKIISTSYNVDLLVDDPLYVETITLAKEHGILIFNSAGNGGELNPLRQKNEDLILVCSVTSSRRDKDKKSKFSNYGTGVDICAPGDPIFSTVQIKYGTKDRYADLRGTSMATPIAAAVAGLIWSVNPNFSAEEVKQKLYDSADDLDKKNKKFKGQLGAGRVNAYKAIK